MTTTSSKGMLAAAQNTKKRLTEKIYSKKDQDEITGLVWASIWSAGLLDPCSACTAVITSFPKVLARSRLWSPVVPFSILYHSLGVFPAVPFSAPSMLEISG